MLAIAVLLSVTSAMAQPTTSINTEYLLTVYRRRRRPWVSTQISLCLATQQEGG